MTAPLTEQEIIKELEIFVAEFQGSVSVQFNESGLQIAGRCATQILALAHLRATDAEPVGMVLRDMAKDGKCGPIAWFRSMLDFPDETKLYVDPPAAQWVRVKGVSLILDGKFAYKQDVWGKCWQFELPPLPPAPKEKP